MNDPQRNALLLDGFLMGIRVVMHAHNLQIPGTEDHKHWELLTEIAEGKTAIVMTQAEKLMKFPNMIAEQKEQLASRTNRLASKDRELATYILEGLDSSIK